MKLCHRTDCNPQICSCLHIIVSGIFGQEASFNPNMSDTVLLEILFRGIAMLVAKLNDASFKRLHNAMTIVALYNAACYYEINASKIEITCMKKLHVSSLNSSHFQ